MTSAERTVNSVSKFACREQVTHQPPVSGKRRDEGTQHNQAGISEQLADFANAPDILNAVIIGKPKILVQAMAHVVPIQQEGVVAALKQP